MKLKFSLVLFLCMAVMACKKEKPATENYPYANRLDTLIHNGIIRTYILHVPASYKTGTKMPLVVGLHGHHWSGAAGFESWAGWDQKADTENFIVAYPNGLHYPWDSPNSLVWNAGGPYEEWTQQNDDVGFISHMIDLISQYYTIDASRVYVTGHSNGARMTYRLGYQLAAKIAAIAPHSGQMIYVPTVPLASPVPVLHLHALDDPTVNYYGTTSGDLPYLPVDTVLGHWASEMSCHTQPDTIFTNADYLVKQWKCSATSPDVLLYVTNRGEHNWFTIDNSGVSATDIIWDFFKTHPKP